MVSARGVETKDGTMTGLWTEIHKARFDSKIRYAETISCADCGAEFPCRNKRENQRLKGVVRIVRGSKTGGK